MHNITLRVWISFAGFVILKNRISDVWSERHILISDEVQPKYTTDERTKPTETRKYNVKFLKIKSSQLLLHKLFWIDVYYA